MKKNDADRIKIVDDIKSADYVTDNYRKKSWGKIKNIELLEKEFVKVYDIIIDGIVINTIYKRIN